MNRTAYIVWVLVGFLSCTPRVYTDQKFFNCEQNSTLSTATAQQKALTAILKRALSTEKDLPGIRSLDDLERIYILDLMYVSAPTGSSPAMKRAAASDIPLEVDSIDFCVKSKRELQMIADKTGAFMYLILGVEELNTQNAILSIESQWQTSKLAPLAIAEGGGYTCRFIKTNRQWTFNEMLTQWTY